MEGVDEKSILENTAFIAGWKTGAAIFLLFFSIWLIVRRESTARLHQGVRNCHASCIASGGLQPGLVRGEGSHGARELPRHHAATDQLGPGYELQFPSGMNRAPCTLVINY